jgi:CDGSH-type Zn-finger protein
MRNDPEDKKRPMIVFTEYSPYMAVDVARLTGPDGEELPLQPVTALCRCGGSANKPYCDGTHGKIGFVGTRRKDHAKNKGKSYPGRTITVHDTRGLCSHSAECLRKLPAVFRRSKRPWIDPSGAAAAEIIKVIKQCPSGALGYTVDGELHKEWGDKEATVAVEKDGPLCCRGYIALKDPAATTPEARSHYTLCRCGRSDNKPFCDGAHRNAKPD